MTTPTSDKLQYTLPPWEVAKWGDGSSPEGCSNVTSPSTEVCIAQDIRDADAHLIAAAPDLYAACQAMVDYYDDDNTVLDLVREAIEKAEGRAKWEIARRKSVQPVKKTHPFEGKRVVAVLPHGFIYYGTLTYYDDGRFTLTNAMNLRYWSARDRGLPEFAKKGPIQGDRIDFIGTIHIEQGLVFYPTGDWS
ncbi:MAG: hypothetical protein M3H12_20010 [Chromatiales bacterium]|nr:hypothetical protein [Gammaproteobacteria bacterium]